MTARFLTPRNIPLSLWNGRDLLSLAPSLQVSYREVLSQTGLLDEARSLTAQGDIGGASEEETAQHFARNFSASCARVELALLDPKDELPNASDLFIRAFSGGRVGLLDIPCGSGAAGATLLTTVAELRRKNVIPREPLEVILVGGDISDSAQNNARMIHTEFQQALHDQAIFVTASFRSWDILNAESTTSLLYNWMNATHGCDQFFVLIANCSGFLGSDANFKRAEERLAEVFRWAEERKATVAWVEPQTNRAMKKMWPKVVERLFKRITGWLGWGDEEGGPLKSEARFDHPLREGSYHPVRLSLLRLERHVP